MILKNIWTELRELIDQPQTISSLKMFISNKK